MKICAECTHYLKRERRGQIEHLCTLSEARCPVTGEDLQIGGRPHQCYNLNPDGLCVYHAPPPDSERSTGKDKR